MVFVVSSSGTESKYFAGAVAAIPSLRTFTTCSKHETDPYLESLRPDSLLSSRPVASRPPLPSQTWCGKQSSKFLEDGPLNCAAIPCSGFSADSKTPNGNVTAVFIIPSGEVRARNCGQRSACLSSKGSSGFGMAALRARRRRGIQSELDHSKWADQWRLRLPNNCEERWS
jgi:hypothetical protein